MNTTYRLTIGDYIEKFLKGSVKGTAVLKEIYKFVQKHLPETAEETIRCAIYRDSKKRFKRVAKGVYMLVGEETASLLINGDGRALNEIEDNSIDAIITDHPWSDAKAHKSGNQKNFADYDTFRYTLEDFKAKARVLKDGAYLAEFLPVESFSNYEYLYEIKQMAKEAGLNYYAKITWRKAPEGAINTGRTTKGVEDICIFYKGKKPRRLSETKTKPYYTSKMLSYTIDIPANKGKDKNHQAEKPIAIYDYLIEMLTDVHDVCLDQFAGSCNLLKSAINKKRFGIAYELCSNFVKKAVDRFGCITLFEQESENDIVEESDTVEMETLTIETIPVEATEFQLKFLNNIKEKRAHMLSSSDIDTINKANEDSFSLASTINELFNKIVKLGYSNYPVPVFNINLEDYTYLNQMEAEICNMFDAKFEDNYLKDYYTNYKIETRAFIEYCLSQKRILTFEYIKVNSDNLISDYIKYIQKNHTKLNYIRSEKLLKEFFA